MALISGLVMRDWNLPRIVQNLQAVIELETENASGPGGWVGEGLAQLPPRAAADASEDGTPAPPPASDKGPPATRLVQARLTQLLDYIRSTAPAAAQVGGGWSDEGWGWQGGGDDC